MFEKTYPNFLTAFPRRHRFVYAGAKNFSNIQLKLLT